MPRHTSNVQPVARASRSRDQGFARLQEKQRARKRREQKIARKRSNI